RYEKPGNLDRAIALLQTAVKTDPAFALAFAALGQAYALKARLSKDPRLLTVAESNARRALQLNGALARVHVVMGEIQSALGNRDFPQDEFQRALNLEPSNPDALSGLAAVFADQHRTAEAEDLYRRASALRPDSWEGYNNLGVFLKAQKRYADA